ncbi:MAG TPA: hypothetical protein ENH14_03600 [candidate division WOR-3 bacterium]|uniref:UVR domain-containing protein n=1 Tax=candidate division WOR-3 bacterium TaxID=2052148 RepID=A0A7V0LUI0_UNCW3|nr:UvrB/UvrC motif-containing protein [Candidatus Hydrothermae bacterium]RKY97897.1 MAG: hypothetical protein DRQ03_03935 [Candidatus Hydrothermae bacterium]HDL60523.1 hypothetical protein [candidate division WOR-3 bacterium]
MPICPVCKLREADTTLVEFVEGRIKKRLLCSICAEKEADGVRSIIITSTEVRRKGKKCPVCGTSLYEFRRSFLMGCPTCYDIFRDELTEILKKVVGRESFLGERPQKDSEIIPLLQERENLMKRLNEAIKKEEFEEAAKLRDEIKKIEEQLQWFQKN